MIQPLREIGGTSRLPIHPMSSRYAADPYDPTFFALFLVAGSFAPVGRVDVRAALEARNIGAGEARYCLLGANSGDQASQGVVYSPFPWGI